MKSKEKKFIDLHLHSYYSDGINSPKDLIQKAKKENLTVISLTDHNSVDGLKEAFFWAKKFKIKIISGVEIDVQYQNYSLHLLGYNFNWQNKELNLVLKKMQLERKAKVKNGIQKLEKLGFKIDLKKVFQPPTSYLGLGKIIDILKQKKNWQRVKRDLKIKRKQIITLPEILNRYFFQNRQHLIPSPKISFIQAVKLIKKAGGFVVLAHPAQQLSWQDDWLLNDLKRKGLDGLEAISAHHNWANLEHYQKLARELKLIVTVGSDYHGELPEDWQFPIRNIWQYFKISLDEFKKIEKGLWQKITRNK